MHRIRGTQCKWIILLSIHRLLIPFIVYYICWVLWLIFVCIIPGMREAMEKASHCSLSFVGSCVYRVVLTDQKIHGSVFEDRKNYFNFVIKC